MDWFFGMKLLKSLKKNSKLMNDIRDQYEDLSDRMEDFDQKLDAIIKEVRLGEEVRTAITELKKSKEDLDTTNPDVV